ncbi:hypothetical protein D9615_008276 [Tricholomella constricta]|uniref:Uncharacterized protein n=1 Tax=Tricholomella constricta TaxID=117010 RepID=A0A8H5M056_9AGAR|nr:hypothetical protein D9615_008276 [Tricholomella constricta]
MAPSSYTRLDPVQPTKGIIRPGARHLSLPLVERHLHAYDGDEESLLTDGSSQWTMSAVPKSSASMYSQESYMLSPPPVFSETRLDRRRFGIAMTPSQVGPWTRPVQSADANNVFVVDLHSATVDRNPFMGVDEGEAEVLSQDEYKERGTTQEKLTPEVPKEVHTLQPVSETAVLLAKEKAMGEKAASKDPANSKLKKFRMSARVIGKMFSRLSVHQSSSSHPADNKEQPLFPAMPPQILISLPSPGLKIPGSPKSSQSAKDDLHMFVLEKRAHVASSVPRNRATLPSTWKPHRPPSPLPKALRHRKNKRSASGLSHLIIASPPPPLPTRTLVHPAPPLPMGADSPKGAYLNFSTPLHSTVDIASPEQESSHCTDIQLRLRMRALKSSTYAIHDGGIISPSSA